MTARFERRAIGFTVYGRLDDKSFQEDLDKAMQRAPVGSCLVDVRISAACEPPYDGDPAMSFAYAVLLVDVPVEETTS